MNHKEGLSPAEQDCGYWDGIKPNNEEWRPDGDKTPLNHIYVDLATTGERNQLDNKSYCCTDTDSSETEVSSERTTYVKGKFLGKGGFAQVHELVDVSTQIVYAGKIIPKNRITKPHHIQKIAREISIHRNLIHKNVVRLHHFFEDKVNAYIVLENCSRKSLFHVLKHRYSVTEPEARFYLKQLVEGVRYIHTQKVIHRDLKPGNMLLSEDMTVKLGDFGLATIADGNKKGSLCGTPNYMAPEVLKKLNYSYEADVWAIGCILYAMLVGQPPFETASLKETYTRIVNNKYTIPLQLSESARKLIRQLLNPYPENRILIDKINSHEFFKNGLTPKSLSPLCCFTAPPFNTGNSKRQYACDFDCKETTTMAIQNPSTFVGAPTTVSTLTTTATTTNTTTVIVTAAAAAAAAAGVALTTTASSVTSSTITSTALTPTVSAATTTIPSESLAPSKPTGPSELITPRSTVRTPLAVGSNSSSLSTPTSLIISTVTTASIASNTTLSSASCTHTAACTRAASGASTPSPDNTGSPVSAASPVNTACPANTASPANTTTSISSALSANTASSPHIAPTATIASHDASLSSPITSSASITSPVSCKSTVPTMCVLVSKSTTNTATVLCSSSNGCSSNHYISSHVASPTISTTSTACTVTTSVTPTPTIAVTGASSTAAATSVTTITNEHATRSINSTTAKAANCGFPVQKHCVHKNALLAKISLKQKWSSVLCPDKMGKKKESNPSSMYHVVMSCLKTMPILSDESHVDPPAIICSPVFVSKWIDYSNKYGFGFQLSNKSVGVLFNDNTRISFSPDKSLVQFHDMNGKITTHPHHSVPEALHQRLVLLEYFLHYMQENLTDGGCVNNPANDKQKSHIIQMKRWVRTNTAIIMELSNGTLQINFFKDHTKIILSSGKLGYVVTYINSERQSSSHLIQQIARVGSERNIRNRLKFAAAVLREFAELDGEVV